MLSTSLIVPSKPAISGFQIHKRALSLEIAESLLVFVKSSSSSLLFSKVGYEIEISTHYRAAPFRLVLGPVEKINEGLILREATRAININNSDVHPGIKVLEVSHEGKLVGAPVCEIHHLGALENCNAT